MLGFRIYKDGIEIEKSSGRNVFLKLTGDIELASIILSELLSRE
jgi:hypothetical protein